MEFTVTGAMKEGKVKPFTKTDLPVFERSGYTLRLKSVVAESDVFDVDFGRPSVSSSFQVGTVRTYQFPNGVRQAHDGPRYHHAELKFNLVTSVATAELR